MQKKLLPLAISLLLGSSFASAATNVGLKNSGFESGMTGWKERDPASISSERKAGKKSLKISGKPGRVSQVVKLNKNRRYQLQAWVKGTGQIFINSGKQAGPGFRNSRFSVNDWTLVKLKFSSSNATSTEFGAKYTGGGDVRFDNFRLLDLSSNASTSPTPSPATPPPSPATPSPTPTPTPATPSPTPTPSSGTGGFGLNPGNSPSKNFDLSEWNLGIPVDNDRNGKSDTIKASALNKGFENEHFYTGNDGGLVFKNYIDGATTSSGTKYTRSELREIIGGDESKGDTEVGPVNWVFSTAPASDLNKSGGVDGVLRATLAINHVTTTGDGIHPGRVIIGQIHARKNEPCRLYYKKLKNNSRGSIYFAHETRDGDEVEINLIGSESSSQSNPSNGIALNEVFTYEISAQGDDLSVSIIREGKKTITKSIDMKNSGYDESGEYMYFKAGLYTQNNTGNDNDYDQATFYEIDTFH